MYLLISDGKTKSAMGNTLSSRHCQRWRQPRAALVLLLTWAIGHGRWQLATAARCDLAERAYNRVLVKKATKMSEAKTEHQLKRACCTLRLLSCVSVSSAFISMLNVTVNFSSGWSSQIIEKTMETIRLLLENT